MGEHTKTPWEVKGGGIVGDGGNRIVLCVSARAECGRSHDDYYCCQTPRAEAKLHLSADDLAFVVKAVNSHDALVKALQTAEAAHKALMGRAGYKTYQALEDRATELRRLALDALKALSLTSTERGR